MINLLQDFVYRAYAHHLAHHAGDFEICHSRRCRVAMFVERWLYRVGAYSHD